MTFEDWFQLRLDSLRRQNEWRKIDCLLASKEYVRDAWEYSNVPEGYVIVPSESTEEMARAFRAEDAPHYFAMTTITCHDFAERYRAMLSAAPKETK